MAVLCDWEIRARCEKSYMVVPFDEKLLNPASLDVLLGNHLMVESIYSTELIRVDISSSLGGSPDTRGSPDRASLESLLELVAVKILSDEHELRRSSDTILPWLVGHTLEQGMYALEHVAVVATLDGEHALHAVKILPVVV